MCYNLNGFSVIEHWTQTSPFTFIVDLTINLMNKSYHECERRDYHPLCSLWVPKNYFKFYYIYLFKIKNRAKFGSGSRTQPKKPKTQTQKRLRILTHRWAVSIEALKVKTQTLSLSSPKRKNPPRTLHSYASSISAVSKYSQTFLFLKIFLSKIPSNLPFYCFTIPFSDW